MTPVTALGGKPQRTKPPAACTTSAQVREHALWAAMEVRAITDTEIPALLAVAARTQDEVIRDHARRLIELALVRAEQCKLTAGFLNRCVEEPDPRDGRVNAEGHAMSTTREQDTIIEHLANQHGATKVLRCASASGGPGGSINEGHVLACWDGLADDPDGGYRVSEWVRIAPSGRTRPVLRIEVAFALELADRRSAQIAPERVAS